MSCRLAFLCGALPAALLLLTPAPTRAQSPAGSPARGQDTWQLEAREIQAKQACEAGRTDEGVRILAELLAQTNDGTYVFNQARCYQAGGRGDQAIAHFRAYLQRPDGDPAVAGRAREYIAALESSKRTGRTAAPEPTVAPAPPPIPALPAPAPTSQPGPDATATARQISPAPAPGRSLRIAGITSAAVGVAALGVGLYFSSEVSDLGEQVARAQAEGKSQSVHDDLNRRGLRAEKLQWGFLGAGAAALSTGAVLYYLGARQRPAHEPTLVLLPQVSPAGGAAILRGSF